MSRREAHIYFEAGVVDDHLMKALEYAVRDNSDARSAEITVAEEAL